MELTCKYLLNKFLFPVEKIIIYKNRNASPKYPPIFILGHPRSGTTLLYQILVHGFNFAYIPNICGDYKNIPIITTFVAKRVCSEYKSDFKSNYGKVKGKMAPKEAGGIWGKWFGYENYIDYENLSRDQIKEITATIALIEGLFEAPFINKNVKHLLRIRALAQIFPSALFIILKRDPVELACSIVRGRKENCKNLNDWWSVKPRNYEQIKDGDYLEQICNQVYFLEKDLEKEMITVGSNRFYKISYDKLCKNVKVEIEGLLAFFQKHQIKLVLKNKLPGEFPLSKNKRLISAEEDAVIRDKICTLYGGYSHRLI